jgi:hypothetical protein
MTSPSPALDVSTRHARRLCLGTMSALRDTRGIVVVRCLHCGHEGSLSQLALARFGIDPYVDRILRETPAL